MHEDGLGEVEETITTGRGGPQGVRKVLPGRGTSGTNFGLRDLGTFSGNGEECTGHIHGVSEIDYGEAIATDSRRNMGDDQGGSSVGSGRNSVVDDLHM